MDNPSNVDAILNAGTPDPTGEPDPAEAPNRTPTYTKEQREATVVEVNKVFFGTPTDEPFVLALRTQARNLLFNVFLNVPQGRSRSLAVTHLEEALMWATKAYYEKD